MFNNETDKLDQHFLIDKCVIKKFIEEANLKKSDVVVEVGPGSGNITNEVAPLVKKMYLIEKDSRLSNYLNNIGNNIEIIYADVLNTYIPKCNKIITSLPYSIIEPFINKIIKCDFEFILMITGSKYANSVVEKQNNKLSLLTNCFFKSEKIMDIEPDSFNPKPRVLSSMIKLIPIKENELTEKIMIVFRNLFFYHEKKLKNALVESLIRMHKIENQIMTQKEAKEVILKLDLDEKMLEKGIDNLSNEEFDLLFNKLNKII